MDKVEALGLGVWAINTLLEPDASSDEDWATFDEKADEARRWLLDMAQQAE